MEICRRRLPETVQHEVRRHGARGTGYLLTVAAAGTLTLSICLSFTFGLCTQHLYIYIAYYKPDFDAGLHTKDIYLFSQEKQRCAETHISGPDRIHRTVNGRESESHSARE
jgi:hypothetical protein